MVNNTIVTAFFDIGRGNFNYTNCETRSAKKYLDYFKFWARIKNDMVVYTQKGLGDKIMQIRRDFNLEKHTTIIEIDDVYDIEPEIFERMKKIELDERYKSFRFFDSEISNIAEYCYVVFMKMWFINDAVKRKLVKNNAVWIDFGFNHGGQCFTQADEFDFEVNIEKKEKVQIYTLPGTSIATTSGIDSLQFQLDTVTSGILVVPASCSEKLYEYCKDSVEALISLDCIDDDQQILLMAAKTHPELFDEHESDWFMSLKEYLGGEHLTEKEKDNDIVKEKTQIRRKLGKIKRKITGQQIVSERFIQRVSEKVAKYRKDY